MKMAKIKLPESEREDALDVARIVPRNHDVGIETVLSSSQTPMLADHLLWLDDNGALLT